jgi:hypothetical protein
LPESFFQFEVISLEEEKNGDDVDGGDDGVQKNNQFCCDGDFGVGGKLVVEILACASFWSSSHK